MGLIQAYLYFHWYPKDHWGIKATVVCVLISETMQITLYFAALYLHLIDGFGNFAGLGVIFWEDVAQVPCGYLSAFLVQMYFGHCIYILNPKRKLVSLVIVFLGLTSLGNNALPVLHAISNSATTMVSYRHKYGIQYRTIATVRTSLTRLDSGNDRHFLVQPGTFYFFLGLVLSGKLYMNSMLATLNTRRHLRRRGTNSQGVFSLDAISGETSQNRAQRPNHASSHNTGIIVLKQSTTTTDDSKTFNAV
ncbi:hypothetical protein DFH08DRAFT_1090314 [Mycena albidolilacea]|uniref:Uncharacterized protein n=1 Tax=Mycena albidolilacea TaxID=1033008 RepID=A0AAD6YXD3_9AGAR|nr:hypothetical protein DFH08DRAFT_1090314 [Mycena albidolilacea]